VKIARKRNLGMLEQYFATEKHTIHIFSKNSNSKLQCSSLDQLKTIRAHGILQDNSEFASADYGYNFC